MEKQFLTESAERAMDKVIKRMVPIDTLAETVAVIARTGAFVRAHALRLPQFYDRLKRHEESTDAYQSLAARSMLACYGLTAIIGTPDKITVSETDTHICIAIEKKPCQNPA